MSDGVKIEGAESMRIEDYILSLVSVSPLSNESNSGLRSWWESSPRYTPQRFLASWKSRRPRPEIANLISELRLLFSSSIPWKPDLLYQLNQLMDLNQPPSVQFPRRVLRSTLLKLVIGVNRQLMVMVEEPEKAHAFRAARQIIYDLLDPFESELYSLCDALEALPTEYSASLPHNTQLMKGA